MKRTLIYSVLISLVLITPFISSNDLYKGVINAKQFWFYGSMALLLFIVGIDSLFRRKSFEFKLNTIDVALLVFYAYYFIRSVFTPYTPLYFNTRFLNYTLLVLFYFVVKFTFLVKVSIHEPGNNSSQNSGNKRQIITPEEILTGFILLTGLAEALWGLLQLYGFKSSFHSGFKLTGTFYNPAPYALYLAAVFPLALGVFLFSKISDQDTKKFLKTVFCALFLYVKRTINRDQLKKQPEIYKISFYTLSLKYLALITFISILLVIPATMIRASWLAVFISGSLLIILRFKLNEKIMKSLYSPVRKVLAMIFIIFFTVLSGTGLFYLKKGSSIGKLLIWEVTIGKIFEKPMFGQGVGRFEAEYNNWQAGYFQSHPEEMDGPKGMAAGNTRYCFNEYLEMGSETGIVGLFLFLGFTGIIVYITFRKFKSNETQFSGYFLYLLSAFISLLVMAMISFPFYSLPTLIVFFFLAAIISSRVTTGVFLVIEKITCNFIRLHRFLLLLVLVPLSALLLIFTRQQYKAYYTFDEAVMLYQTGSYGEACKSFSEVYFPLQYTGPYLQYYGKALNMNEEYPRSIEMLERAAHFTSDEILYTTLGDTYKALKRYSEAEEAYQHASFMVPHKLYPLYLLANFYDETGQQEKALRTAEEVLTKIIKVESTATEEIMHDMKELIRKLKNR